MNLYKNKNNQIFNLNLFVKIYVIKDYDTGFCIEGMDIHQEPWTIDDFATIEEAEYDLQKIYDTHTTHKTPDPLSDET